MRTAVIEAYRQRYGRPPAVAARAPGRLEVLGNHTDYNEGVVLSVAVDRSKWVALGPGAGDRCRVYSGNTKTLRAFSPSAVGDPIPGDWANYIKGILVELERRGISVPVFDAVIDSTVPISAGMSSSAALEMSFSLALAAWAGIELSWIEWAKVGQAAENHYVGARTGLLDQFSSLRGKAGHLVFSDFRSLEVENVPLPQGTALVVADSMVKHQLTNEYNERRERCEQAVEFLQARYPEVKALRDVSREQLEACREDMEFVVWRRAMHVVGENERVFAGIEALRRDDLATFGRLMVESHESSRNYFENSAPELDILVELGQALPGFIGARLSGGGFGGITVHLVSAPEAGDYARRLAVAYETRTGQKPGVMVCRAEDGAEVFPVR